MAKPVVGTNTINLSPTHVEMALQRRLIFRFLLFVLFLVMAAICWNQWRVDWNFGAIVTSSCLLVASLVTLISLLGNASILFSRKQAPEAVRTRRYEWYFVGVFLLVQIVAPFAIGELYPFTTSPMFSDRPQQYAVYRVMDDAGKAVDPGLIGLHLVYDGNPPGFGVGIRPLSTVHEFGEVAEEPVVRKHVQLCFETQAELPDTLVIEQEVVRPAGEKLKSIVNRWVIQRAGISAKPEDFEDGMSE